MSDDRRSRAASDALPWIATPRGARDLLPPQCRRRRALTSTLLGTFESWGYEPVATPAIEFFEVLARGLSDADRRDCVRFIAPGNGELVTLRADVTPQIARMVAQRWGGEMASDVVHRFSYAAEVLRQPTEAREQAEVHQVGIELLGDDDPAADAELVALADACLQAAGLADFRIDLAHTAVARDLLGGLSLADRSRERAQLLLARKDRAGLARVLEQAGVEATAAAPIVALCDLFGAPDAVLPRARTMLQDAGVDAALDQLATALEHVPGLTPHAAARVVLDLGEARGFDYYSGIRLRVWAPGVQHPVVRGGRYDSLPRRFGVPRSATGFAVDLDALESALAQPGGGLALDEAPPAHLVVVAGSSVELRARAHAIAKQARENGRRAWVQPRLTQTRAQALAEQAGADEFTIVDEQGDHRWSRGSQGWTAMQTETGNKT